MNIANISIPDRLNKRLILLSKSLGVTRSYIIRNAVNAYLLEIEDLKDVAIII
jgi:predicted DNA-binding protein